jgi:hypothetical protein
MAVTRSCTRGLSLMSSLCVTTVFSVIRSLLPMA